MSISTKKVNALMVAEYFLDKANKDKKPITNKKLQKLVYYAQAWSLVLKDTKLFNEPIEAWVHGPAIKSLYVQYRNFGFNPILKEVKAETIKDISTDTKKLLDKVWNVYGNLDADYLEMLTHSEKPWQEAREELQSYEKSENEISTKTMKSYYTQKLEESRKK